MTNWKLNIDCVEEMKKNEKSKDNNMPQKRKEPEHRNKMLFLTPLIKIFQQIGLIPKQRTDYENE